MALSTQPYKGARDFYPEDKRLQKFMFASLRQTVEKYGYEEYDAPLLEPLEMYLAKTGEEIVDEQTYSFTDRGGRKVVIRPEMTPTVSRMVAARRQELGYPLRWYSIPNLWRYERPQRGRLREHWQLNVDIFGVADIAAEIEIIHLANQIFKDFGAKPAMYEIHVNSRKLIEYLLRDYLKLNQVESSSMVKLIDRMHKVERSAFITQADAICSPGEREEGIVEKLLEVLSVQQLTDLPAVVQEHESVQALKRLLHDLSAAGVDNAIFDVSIMRGFDYYTDVVFEIMDTDPENNRSMMGGGRYDGLVGLFGVEPVPTVGFGLGDATLANFLELHNLVPEVQTETDLYAVIVGDVAEAARKPVTELREMGVRIAVDTTGRKVGDQLKTADKKSIHYAIIIGEAELGEEQYTLKHLGTGTEEKHGLQRIVSIVKDYRRSNDRH